MKSKNNDYDTKYNLSNIYNNTCDSDCRGRLECIKADYRNSLECIKATVVYDEKTVQSINDFYFPAPIGVSIDKNGVINSKILFELIEPLKLISSINVNLIVSQGLLHLKLTFKNPEICPCSDLKKEICKELYIPIQNVTTNRSDCNDSPNEISTTTKITSISVFGFPDAENHEIGEKITLIIKVVLDIHYEITKNEVITVLKNVY